MKHLLILILISISYTQCSIISLGPVKPIKAPDTMPINSYPGTTRVSPEEKHSIELTIDCIKKNKNADLDYIVNNYQAGMDIYAINNAIQKIFNTCQKKITQKRKCNDSEIIVTHCVIQSNILKK